MIGLTIRLTASINPIPFAIIRVYSRFETTFSKALKMTNSDDILFRDEVHRIVNEERC